MHIFTEAPGHTPLPLVTYHGYEGVGTMLVRCDKAVSKNQVELIAFGPNGWHIPAARPSGADQAWFVGVVQENVAGSRGTYGRGKTVGDWITVQVAGRARDAVLPASITTSGASSWIGYTGGSAALAAGNNRNHKAVFAQDIGTFGAGTTKDLFLFGRICRT